MKQETAVGVDGATVATAARVGFWVAIMTAMMAATAFGIGIMTPPRAGAFCPGPCVVYPYTDAAQFVPRDYYWLIPGILLTPLFLVLAGCLHGLAREGRRLFGLLAVCFATAAMVVVTLDYFVQHDVVIPSLLKGEAANLTLFSQYNAHGLFIALEDLGYLLLSAAFVFAGLALERGGALAGWIRWIFLVSGALAVASYMGMSWRFGADLDVRFELAVISITWTALLVEGVLLAMWFRRIGRGVANGNGA